MLAAVEDPERSAGYSQLLEIHTAVSSGVLSAAEAEPLWNELEGYLEQELEKFSTFPTFDWLEYMDGLESVDRGLRLLLEAVGSLRQGGEGLEKAEEGNALLCQGRELLLEAHELTEEDASLDA